MRYLLPYLPDTHQHETYRGVRHDTLNFETTGGERASCDDASLQPLAQIIAFPSRVEKDVEVHIQRKGEKMTEDHNTTPDSDKSPSTKRVGGGVHRVESFATTAPAHVSMSTRSGDVRVRAIEGTTLEVTLTSRSSKDDELVETAELHFDAQTNHLDIRTQPREYTFGVGGGRSSKKRSWFDFGGNDVDVAIVVPRGSSIEVKTISGDVSLKGELGDVTVSSVSGDVNAHDTTDSLEVRTASGDVTTGKVESRLKCRSASGDVDCSSAAVKTDITSASGDVVLAADRPGDIVVKAVSGDVRVRVAKGLAVDISGNTVSGDMGSNIELDAKGDDSGAADTIYIKVTTVSGDIRIDKAS